MGGFRRWVMAFVAAMAGLAPGVGVLGSDPAAAAATPRVDIGDVSTWEGTLPEKAARVLSFPVTLSDPVTSDVTITYHVMGGTATGGRPGTGADFYDFKGASRTLLFRAGTAQSKFVNVRVFPDALDEGDETVMVMIESISGPAELGDSSGLGTILDDDPGTGPRLGVSDATISEGDSGKRHVAKFWVNLSEPATTTVTVHVMTMDMSTTGGADYRARMRDITFLPGQVRKPYPVVVFPDTNPEPDEQFHVMLSNAVGATIADDTGMGTILTDDGEAMTTESFLIGPFNLAAMGQPGSESDTSANVPRPAGSFGIKSMTFDIVDESGDPVDMHDVHLHHIVMLDWSRPDAVCSGWPSRFTGSGKERTPWTLGDNYAYNVESTDQSWSALWHVMNMSMQQRTVYIKYTIGYVGYGSPAAARDVTPYWYDVTGPCTNSEYDVPGDGGPGSIHTASRTFTAPKNGTRVAVGGHLHDGGIDITMTRTATGEVVCTNEAHYPMPGMLHSISACNDHTSVTAGEQFTTTARYDNSAPVSGAMGIQLNYVWEP
jgi:hypothetical protein